MEVAPMTIAQRLGAINAHLEHATKCNEFIALARCITLSKGSHHLTGEIARDARLSPTVMAVLDSPTKVYDIDMRLQKTAVAAGTTADSGWAGPLANYDVLANAFLSSLVNYGAFDRLLPAMLRVPMRVRVGASTVAPTADSAVGQGMVKPISRLTMTGMTVDERKASRILVVTEELARFSQPAAGNLLTIELSSGVALATDTDFVSVLTAGATSNGSSGVTAEHVRNDLRAALAAVTIDARSVLYLLVTPTIAKTLSILHTTTGEAAFPGLTHRGGQIAGIEVVPSDGVPSNTMVLVDASQVAAASERIQLTATDTAPLQLDTTPDSPPGGNTSMVSLWQMNLLGLKAERFFGCTKLTSTAAAVVTNVSYLGDSP
jgi:hypothetical protein